MVPNPADPTARAFRSEIDRRITDHLDLVAGRLAQVSPTLAPLIEVATDLIGGGKRLRPAFGYWGYVAVAGAEAVPEGLWRVVSALELLHLGVLVHDDVLDAADTRRGRPAAHRQFEAWHRQAGGVGDAAEFGEAMAVLLGDQLIVWSGELAETGGLSASAWAAAGPFWHAVRTEVNSGQVLDVCAQYGVGRRPGATAEELAFEVLEEKTSRYTVQRPVQLGAAAAGAGPEVLAALADYGLALGRAFQLRDDVLGIFGAERQTGKPAAGDLREGKRTVLLARTLELADAEQAAELRAMVGHPELTDQQIRRAQQIITQSGALDQIEELIEHDHAQAVAALDRVALTDLGRAALVELARQCVERNT